MRLRESAQYINFFLTAPTTTQTYTLSLHDALPIFVRRPNPPLTCACRPRRTMARLGSASMKSSAAGLAGFCLLLLGATAWARSEEHTSELQSRRDLVCRLLLEKKKKIWTGGNSFSV